MSRAAQRNASKHRAHDLTQSRVVAACRAFQIAGRPFTLADVAEASCAAPNVAAGIAAQWADVNNVALRGDVFRPPATATAS